MQTSQRDPSPRPSPATGEGVQSKPRGIIDNPDIDDLAIELRLCRLLQNASSIFLTYDGRLLLQPLISEMLYAEATVKRIVSELFRDGEPTITRRKWIERFLQFVLDDAQVYGILDEVQVDMTERMDRFTIRTRAFDLLLGLSLLERAAECKFVFCTLVDGETLVVRTLIKNKE